MFGLFERTAPARRSQACSRRAFLVRWRVATSCRFIAMHTSAPSGHKGPEVALVGSGAGIDVFGESAAHAPGVGGRGTHVFPAPAVQRRVRTTAAQVL